VFDVHYDMYQARFGLSSQCGEQVHDKSREIALGCSQMDIQILKKVLQTMTSILYDRKMICQLWDMWMQIMQGIWMTRGRPQVMCSHLQEDQSVGDL
jgi:hypothetical protein